jgi:hypothetical protein
MEAVRDIIVEDALQAFWKSVAASYPNITTGDLEPAITHNLYMAAETAIKVWVKTNSPDTTAEDFQKIVEILSGAFGLDASVEDGPVTCIVINLEGRTFYFGTANTTWGGSEVLADGDIRSDFELTTHINSDEPNAGIVAHAIYNAVDLEWNRSRY